MATKYLLQCDCGNQQPVTTHQAGSQVSCNCGQRLDVPPLRKLRHLPVQPEQAAGHSGTWTFRHAVATGGSIVTLALLTWAGWLWRTEPVVPQFDPQRHATALEAGLDRISPAELWTRWHYEYETLPEQGFEVFSSPRRDYLQTAAEQQRLLRRVILAIAGVVALASAVGYCLPATARSSRR